MDVLALLRGLLENLLVVNLISHRSLLQGRLLLQSCLLLKIKTLHHGLAHQLFLLPELLLLQFQHLFLRKRDPHAVLLAFDEVAHLLVHTFQRIAPLAEQAPVVL